tara:strand:+ start:102892 stop:103326 length:435 start_codon:yes stop_codon:yes gene_type:complete
MLDLTVEEITANAYQLFGPDVDPSIVERYVQSVQSLDFENKVPSILRLNSYANAKQVYQYARLDYNTKVRELQKMSGEILHAEPDKPYSSQSQLLDHIKNLLNQIKIVNSKLETAHRLVVPGQDPKVDQINSELEEIYPIVPSV